mmetsp:Transcript_31364/g.79297  ORF Transcript_31364/g.79297 Transcript_31364/m.79297 type:complete len:158 (-) Transcript_31364:162-635(-)
MGANCSSNAARDAYGSWLQEGCWVECTNGNFAENAQGYGRVQYILDDRVTFKWGLLGSYTYDEKDIRYYGIRKIIADKDGRKLKEEQLVETRDGAQGVVQQVSEWAVTFTFTGRDWTDRVRTYQQADIDNYGIRIMGLAGTLGSSVRDRKCTSGACI